MVVVEGWKIKAIREEMGLSRKECCRRAGITETTLRRLETEEGAEAMPKTVRAVACVLGTKPGLLGVAKKRLADPGLTLLPAPVVALKIGVLLLAFSGLAF